MSLLDYGALVENNAVRITKSIVTGSDDSLAGLEALDDFQELGVLSTESNISFDGSVA